jgi:hypothetical protein
MEGQERLREVVDEFRAVVLRRGGILDGALPPTTFLIVRALAGDQAAMLASLAIGGGLVMVRRLRREPVVMALLGLGGSLFAFAAARGFGRAELFFVPDFLTNVALSVLCLISVGLRQPLVAWTSHLVRRWPRGWYWHPRVRPAYSEVTLAWALFFLLQAGVQFALLRRQDVSLIAVSNLLSGWPATVVLLVLSYLYGTWRLRQLSGPSVTEFAGNVPEPWSGQRRGF